MSGLTEAVHRFRALDEVLISRGSGKMLGQDNPKHGKEGRALEKHLVKLKKLGVPLHPDDASWLKKQQSPLARMKMVFGKWKKRIK